MSRATVRKALDRRPRLFPAGARGFQDRSLSTRPRVGLGVRLAMGLSYLIVALHRWIDRGLDRLGFEPIDELSMDGLRDELISFQPDASLGPILTPTDAPRLFETLSRLAGKIRCRLPSEVRLSHLPMCGVLEVADHPWHKRPVLVIGLPCLHVWSFDELRAVLAHELAHLRFEDARFNRDVLCLAQTLRTRLESTAPSSRRRLRGRLARLCAWLVEWTASPVSRWMEFRADHCSAETCSSAALSTAIEKMAVVQPVFQELLERSGTRPDDNVYRRLSRAWKGLSGGPYDRLKDWLVDREQAQPRGPVPRVDQRLRRLRGGPVRRSKKFHPSLHLLDDPKLLETLLHNHLIGGVFLAEPTLAGVATVPSRRVN